MLDVPFMLTFKFSEGLSDNRRLMYLLLASQAPRTQALLPAFIAKREVDRLPPAPSPEPEDHFQQLQGSVATLRTELNTLTARVSNLEQPDEPG